LEILIFSEKSLLPIALVGCHIVLLCSAEEREGEDGDDGNDCRAIAAWKSDWRKTSVFTMSLLQYISFRDKALLPGREDWASNLSWSVHLISISDRIKPALIWARCSSFLVARTRKEWGLFRTVTEVDPIRLLSFMYNSLHSDREAAALPVGNLSSRQSTGRKRGGIPRDLC